mmetsp:Transcript_27927/g.42558  ORF Transcript_27927/g.42558 Transcript_27927/m.42558 type:complete len:522 (-) Transcript_27927:893-2458(-)|eukprot:CAMPEP_0194224044 /NCGR_PEP_ID=MMETSP0156-20130528/36532_1 /TAXON_ID=33649 /ORGANISM="Thalassionema nitzschioides, Strain L26-B" /LENGTH=521 /DNA_ID=CAMNT_0038955429 /DNA_START=89 /DNA_END=1654 /DNA_ORIENTATION=+
MLRRCPRFLLCACISIYGGTFFFFSLDSCAAFFVRGTSTLLLVHARGGCPSLLFSSSSSKNDDWDYSFQLYLNHTRDTGDRNIPLAHPELGNWVRMQRTHHKQLYQQADASESSSCSLTNERLQKLKNAGFVFDVQFYSWKKSYDELAQYYKDHGHNASVVSNSPLGRWAGKQRSLYRDGLLSEERQKLLEELEFWVWDLREQSYREKIRQLKNMDKLTKWSKTSNLPWDIKPQDGPLGLFMCNQRTRYRKYCEGKIGHGLQDYQIDLLENELGMDCDTCRKKTWRNESREPVDVDWENRMNQLQLFRKQHGHANVPRTYSGGENLGQWVAKVRERYVHYDEDSPEYLQKRVAALEAMGFVWDLCEYRWQRKFEELIDYYEQYGDVNVPDSLGSLGPWIREQRQEYHKFRKGIPSRLTPSHALALKRMGLDFNRQATNRRKQEEVFRQRINEYRDYYGEENEEKNRPSVSSLPKSLKYWVERQRRIYRQWLQGQKELSEDRRKLLEEAGVVHGIADLPTKK